jgi:hypothetical protein
MRRGAARGGRQVAARPLPACPARGREESSFALAGQAGEGAAARKQNGGLAINLPHRPGKLAGGVVVGTRGCAYPSDVQDGHSGRRSPAVVPSDLAPGKPVTEWKRTRSADWPGRLLAASSPSAGCACENETYALDAFRSASNKWMAPHAAGLMAPIGRSSAIEHGDLNRAAKRTAHMRQEKCVKIVL